TSAATVTGIARARRAIGAREFAPWFTGIVGIGTTTETGRRDVAVSAAVAVPTRARRHGCHRGEGEEYNNADEGSACHGRLLVGRCGSSMSPNGRCAEHGRTGRGRNQAQTPVARSTLAACGVATRHGSSHG